MPMRRRCPPGGRAVPEGRAPGLRGRLPGRRPHHGALCQTRRSVQGARRGERQLGRPSTSPPCRSPRARPAALRAVGLRPMSSGWICAAACTCCTRWIRRVRFPSCWTAMPRTCAARCREREPAVHRCPAIVGHQSTCPDSLRVTLPAGANLDAVRRRAEKALHDLTFTQRDSCRAGPRCRSTLAPSRSASPGLRDRAEPRHSAQPRQ